jgi:O-antigen/teichoic acid export membrane protein
MIQYIRNRFLTNNSSVQSLVKDSGLYILINVVERGVAFLMLPIIVRLVPTEEYGKYALYLTLESMLMPIVTLNIYSSISKNYYDENFTSRKYNPTILLSLPILSFAFFAVSLLLPYKLIQSASFDVNLIAPAIFTSSLTSAIVFASTFFRLKRNPRLYGIYSISQAVLLFVFLIIASNFNSSVDGLIWAKIIHGTVIFIITIFYLYSKKDFSFSIDWGWLKKAFSLALPTVIYSVSAFVFVMSDRLFINYYFGASEVGFYAGISQVAAIISVFTAAFNAAWMPWLFENLKKKSEEVNAFVVKITYFCVLLFALVGFIFCIAFPIILKIVLTPSFYPYIHIGFFIITGLVFQGIYLLVSPYVYYAGKTKYHAIIGLIVAIINVGLNFIMIPRLGILGASISYMLTWMVLALLFFFASNKVYPMPWFPRLSSKTS